MWFSAASDVLSKPTTATSSGTTSPPRSTTSIAPTADRSLAVKIAVGIAPRRRRCAAWGGAGTLAPVDVGDVSMPQRVQVLDCQTGTFCVVRRHRTDGDFGERAA